MRFALDHTEKAARLLEAAFSFAVGENELFTPPWSSTTRRFSGPKRPWPHSRRGFCGATGAESLERVGRRDARPKRRHESRASGARTADRDEHRSGL